MSLDKENKLGTAEDTRMQKYARGLALIPQGNGARSTWFCHWDQENTRFDFVTSERVGDESFRDCIDREIVMKLGLRTNDFLVANMAQLNLEFAAVLPGYEESNHVMVAFFLVQLYSRASRQKLKSFPGGRWLTGHELLEGKTTDGEAVNPVLTYLLKRSEVIRPW
jgi:hypothetical protein